MFERYTESARRALFFARFEASELSHDSIETVHLLLGIVRAGKGVTAKLLGPGVSYDAVRSQVEPGRGAKLPTSVEIPFSAETRRVLDHAAQESDLFGHSYIGTEHLLLGVLREDRSRAAAILTGLGMQLESARAHLTVMLDPLAADARGRLSALDEEPVADLRESIEQVRFSTDRRERIEEIRQLLARLEHATPATAEARDLVSLIRQLLETL